ncbi:U4/U6-U5 snRNP complex subunit dib1 [Xylographa soralifera]|nr:U4/U6-U5 snRNP complex subunit dib1 [Xylographa soralifera]
MGSVVLPHLVTGWHVDQAIMSEEERLVVIRFGRDWDPDCMRQDEVLYRIADRVKNFAVLYVCDLDQVPDFKQMYELYDPVTLMFFFRNKHMMCDFGTGNNNKLNWVLEDKQELIDIIETIYRGAKKGRGLVVSPKDFSYYNRANGDAFCEGYEQVVAARGMVLTNHAPLRAEYHHN